MINPLPITHGSELILFASGIRGMGVGLVAQKSVGLQENIKPADLLSGLDLIISLPVEGARLNSRRRSGRH